MYHVKYLSMSLIITLASAVACLAADTGQSGSEARYPRELLMQQSVFPAHEPMGQGVGANPGRVAWAHEPNSVNWDGRGYWWEPQNFSEAVVLGMVEDGIAALAGAENPAEGWEILFKAHNARRGLAGGYEPGQKIAIKTNMNGAGSYAGDDTGETHESFTNPVLLKCLLLTLVKDAGAAPGDITVYDAGRIFPAFMRELCTQGPLAGVRFRYRDPGGPDDALADKNAPVIWSKPVRGDDNYLPVCVTEADYLINLANLKGHYWGITLCAKNHFGSILNSNRRRAPEAAGIHRYVSARRMDEYTVLVDLTANYQLGAKTVLCVLDALIVAPGESVGVTRENSLWQQAPFNNHYTASVFFSQDPVAIDSVGADFLMHEPAVTSRNGALRNNPNVENYLHEAGSVARPPSGTTYQDGNGRAVANLGVHEHWNNPRDKLYGRNLGRNEGVELVRAAKRPGA